MINNEDEFLGIDKNSNFALRVLVLSVPAGLIFFILGVYEILSFQVAVTSYMSILFFNTVFLMPISMEIQKIKKYIINLSEGTEQNISIENMSEKETRDLTVAINSMHKFWINKTEMLEKKTLSDAAVLDTLPQPLLMVNKDKLIIGANKAIRELLGKDILNENIFNYIDDKIFLAAIEKIFNQESRQEDLRLVLNSNKEKLKFHVNIVTLPWFAKGEIVVVVSFYDLTKMMQLEQMQRDFVANASHELRTPLAVISGFVETLRTSAKDDEAVRDKFLKIIAEQTSYMSLLIEDLLSLSKIEMSVDNQPNEKVKVNDIVKEVSEAFNLKAKERNLTLNYKYGRFPQIVADSRQITQVVQNLCSNAVKYAYEGSEIYIKTEKVTSIPENNLYDVEKGEAVAISISNKGVNISGEDLARLTERFFRLSEHKNQSIKGTGLGLAIVSQILKRHRGNLEITSVDGLTTFKVFLPIGNNKL